VRLDALSFGIRDSGGVLLEGGRIPHDFVESRVRGPSRGNLTAHKKEIVMLRRRPIARTMARTAVVAGTATVVAGGVSRHQQQKYAAQDAAAQPAPQQEVAYAAPPPAPAGGMSPDAIEELKQLAQLKDQGILTEEEFAAQKAKILGA
jgi:negative regulator of sigma E activity